MVTSEVSLPRLVIVQPAERAGILLLSGPQLVIGHSESADLVIEDQYVSGRHALVTVDELGQVTIRDLNSTGGTFVNGEQVTGGRVLEPGDEVRLADVVARFEAGAGISGAAAPPTVATTVLSAPADGGGTPPSADIGVLGTPYTVTGTVYSPALPGIPGLTVQLVDKNVGGDTVLLPTTQTGSNGQYAVTVRITAAYLTAHAKTSPDLQVHVSAVAVTGAPSPVLASSAVAYSAPTVVTLDVTLPAGAAGLPSEYEILTASLTAAYPGDLSELQEGNGRADITYLAGRTELDARAAALIANATKLGQLTASAPGPAPAAGKTASLPVPVSLQPAFYYALLRAGLPADAATLLRTSPADVQAIWEQATSHGVIPAALAAQIPGALANYTVLSGSQLLSAAPAAGLSTLDQMLQATLADTTQRGQFAQLYVQYTGNPVGLWSAVTQQFGAAVAGRLQFTGQLYYLTINNEPLVTALLAAEKDTPQSAADLATLGFYDAAKWAPLIGTAIPPSIPGGTAAEQAANYADLLAAQVRVSFPTLTLAGKVRAGVIPVTGNATIASRVADFLTASQATFDIGAEPVQAYLARTGTAAPDADVLAQVSRLQRVRQLTVDDPSMTVLLNNGLDSAYAITRYDAAGFTRAFSGDLGGDDTAAAIYARAGQVFAATLSVAVGYLGARVIPTSGGQLPGLTAAPPSQSATGYPVIAFPTLENLFGSLDYCDCQDCGSILSPAAYLVDLLNYTDLPAPASGANPQGVLLARRPDLQYLPLTCANTNTALPYIDLVNEALEYYVANGFSMAGYQGQDTGDTVTSAELIASPQYVNDAAYTALQGVFFPDPLPFTRPLTLLRLQMNALGVALPDAMAALRASDSLAAGGGPGSYGWTDTLIEQAGISRDEYRIFTDPTLTLGDLWGVPAAASPLTALQGMSLADLSRRLGVSYDDLTAIVTTRFINPNAALIPRLTRLNASFATIKELHDNLGTAADITASFILSLPAGLDATQYGGTSPGDYTAVVSWVTGADVYPLIMDIITITAPADGAADCSGADLFLRYANPDTTANALTAADYTRLIRFIRLWRKLTPLLADPSDAASIQHTDDILAALLPASPATAEAGFEVLLQRLGFLLRVMEQLALSGGASLPQLLACWAPIGTAAITGQDSLYQDLFLTPALLQQDPAFADNGYGDYLTDASQTLLAHQPALCAACGLTGAEFTLITGALGFGPATPLTLGNVSAVFRFGWLAHTLGLSVVEFIALRQYSGLDPFTALDPGTAGPAEPATVRFVRLISAFTTTGLTPTQVLYLIWNADLTGTSAPAPGDVTGLAAALRGDFAAVEAQFAVQDDPTGAIAKSLVTLLYGTAAADFLFGLVNGTYTTTVPYSTPPGQPGLPAAVIAAAGGQLSYSGLNEQLSYAGVLDPTTQAAIDAAAAGDTALQAAVAQLETASQQAVTQFLAAYPDLQPGYNAYLDTAGSPADKRTAMLGALLPTLTALRKQEQALATVTAAAGSDPSFASGLLTAAAVLHADDGPAKTAASSDLTAVEQQGLAVVFYPGNDPAGTLGGTADATGVLAYGPGLASQLPPGNNGGPVAGVWDGYLTAPQDGGYYIAVTADPGATVTLVANGMPVPGTVTNNTWQNETAPVQLVAGQLTPVTLTVTGLRTTLSVSWQGPGLGWQLIPGQYLYSRTLVARLGDTYTRFLKAVSLAGGLSLTAAETAYLAMALSPTASGSWLNDLAVTGAPDAATAAGLRDVLTGLLDFSRIKLALSPRSPGDGRLLAVLQDPSALLPGGQPALASLTGWAQDSLDALLTRFFGSTDPKALATVANFARVYDASAVVAACGLSAAVLVPAITDAPTPDTVSALQAALRSHYAEQDWLTVIKPVRDAARVRQRDALVARILAYLGDGYTPPTITLTTTAAAVAGATTIECSGTAGVVPGMTIMGGGLAPGTTVTWTGPAAIALSTGVPAALPAGTALSTTVTGNPYDSPDSLLAPFLVDVETQPPVLTSRIRLALSQVQLFVERVIRNLEPGVSAGDFDPARWEWTKRYRLWQANREVFLWPENWLFPELRDDQSPLFTQVMGSLLQGDITDDAAAGAYLDYLSGLEEVAKLEPCGLYYQPADGSVTETSYLVARTKGAHRKHFFRELTDGTWGPWTQMMIDPEDMPVTPIVWNGRLLCCWLKAVNAAKQPQGPQVTPSADSGTTLATLAISDLNSSVTASTTAATSGAFIAQVALCWAEYYNGKWQPTKTSDISLPTMIGPFDQAGYGSFDAVRNQLRIVPGQFTGTNPALAGHTGAGAGIPSDALFLAIAAPSGYAPRNAGFILHNTNGAVCFDDIELSIPIIEDGYEVGLTVLPLAGALDLPPQRREFSPALAVPYTGTYGPARFTAALQDASGDTVNSADLLQFSWLPRVTDSQPGLPGQWTAPFLYEDHRRVFYVTTTQSAWRLPGIQVFGQLPVTRAPIAATSMPPLVLPPRPTAAARGESVAVDAAGASPSAMQRYLAQTPGLKAALPLPAPVTYQGQVIYPTGSLAADAPALNGPQGAQS